jgi:hypothetical protein
MNQRMTGETTFRKIERRVKETLNKDEFRNFGGYWFLMTLQRPEKLRFAAWDDVSVPVWRRF